jgi:hypothetical protein
MSTVIGSAAGLDEVDGGDRRRRPRRPRSSTAVVVRTRRMIAYEALFIAIGEKSGRRW